MNQQQQQQQIQKHHPYDLHPVQILDSYLMSILEQIEVKNQEQQKQQIKQDQQQQHLDRSRSNSNSRTNFKQKNDENNNDEIRRETLKLCDFLFTTATTSSNLTLSPTSPLSYSNNTSSLFESAIELLDSSSSSSMSTSTSINPSPTPPVRLIKCFTSGRSMIVVRGSNSSRSVSSNSNNYTSCRKRQRIYHHNGKDKTTSTTASSEYLITIGQQQQQQQQQQKQSIFDTSLSSSLPVKKNNNKKKNTDFLSIGKIGYHCTCRSFYERLKRGHGTSSSNNASFNTLMDESLSSPYRQTQQQQQQNQQQQQQRNHQHWDKYVICKHILAARIAPFLNSKSPFHHPVKNTLIENKNNDNDDNDDNDDLILSRQRRRNDEKTGIVNNSHDDGDTNFNCYQEVNVDEDEFNRIYVNLSMNIWY